MITMGMPPGRPPTLAELRYHWGSAYGIDVDWGRWTARRRDGLGTLSAASAEELRRLIIADYTARRVPRGLP